MRMSLNTNLFTHSAKDKEFVAEVSDLNLGMGRMPDSISLVSAVTGRRANFVFSSHIYTGDRHDEDRELAGWIYRIAMDQDPALIGYTIHILND